MVQRWFLNLGLASFGAVLILLVFPVDAGRGLEHLNLFSTLRPKDIYLFVFFVMLGIFLVCLVNQMRGLILKKTRIPNHEWIWTVTPVALGLFLWLFYMGVSSSKNRLDGIYDFPLNPRGEPVQKVSTDKIQLAENHSENQEESFDRFSP